MFEEALKYFETFKDFFLTCNCCGEEKSVYDVILDFLSGGYCCNKCIYTILEGDVSNTEEV